MKHLVIFLLAALTGWLPATLAAAPKPQALAPLSHRAAELTVVGPDGSETSYTPAELERFPTYRLSTTTPWRPDAADFDGVLLRDVLAASGLEGVDEILVTAENDYTAIIPRAVWESIDVVIATRVDGEPHTRRARGPIQFVMDMEAYTNSDVTLEDHLVWMAARIEPAQ